jgi:pSer/pThr/pTyr-binding forkhead associated (FHA) protein
VRLTVPPAANTPKRCGEPDGLDAANHDECVSLTGSGDADPEGEASNTRIRPGVRWVLRSARGEFLLAASVVVGRGVGADLQTDDESVSRRHASFRPEADGVWVEDLSSRNGTWVNGAPISAPHRLTHGDRISLGACELELLSVTCLDESRVTQPLVPTLRPTSSRSCSPSQSASRSLDALSPRERAVFPLLASGLSQREIASQCGVTVKTIETYRTRIGHKLGLSTRAELIRFALEIGVLRPSSPGALGQVTESPS